MTVFYLIRHGKHTYESVKDKGFIGHGLDLAPLSDEGVMQVFECSKDIRHKDCDLIISSPYTRTMQTSAILSRHLEINIKVEIDLREQVLDLSYRVKSYDELRQIVIEEQRHNGGISINEAYKWEPRLYVKERVLNVLKQYTCYSKIIVVCHGMVIHCFTGMIGIPNIPNCSIHEIIIE